MIRFGDITVCRDSRTIMNGVRQYRWQNNTRRLIQFKFMQHLILGGGLTLGQLFDLLYGDDPDGGPDKGIELIRVMLCHMAASLKALDLRLLKENRGGQKHYYVAR